MNPERVRDGIVEELDMKRAPIPVGWTRVFRANGREVGISRTPHVVGNRSYTVWKWRGGQPIVGVNVRSWVDACSWAKTWLGLFEVSDGVRRRVRMEASA